MNEKRIEDSAVLTNRPDELLERILDIGELMLQSGAEINRVEDTLARISRAYSARADVFVILYSIVITLRFSDGTFITQTRRVADRDDIDFDRLDRLNDLSRKCCAHPMSVEELDSALERIRSDSNRLSLNILGNVLGAFSFSVFFGGKVPDGVMAAFFSLLIVFLQNTLGRYSSNRILHTLIISGIVGTGIGAACRLLPFLNLPMVMIGDIMLLNPGITMINAVREMMVGNNITGQIRFFESFGWALSLAAGFMLAMHLTGAV